MVIFAQANISNAKAIEEGLRKIEDWSGLGANKLKSGIYFNKAAKPMSKARIKATLNLKTMDKDALYLGLPFFRRNNRAKRYPFLFDR